MNEFHEEKISRRSLGLTACIALIDATPTDACAVENTACKKLIPVVHSSVCDFGAVGDGITDDTVSIQIALNSLGTFSYSSANSIDTPTMRGRGILNFPSGVYLISATLFFPADCELRGVGYSTQLKFIASSGVNLFEKDIAKATKYTGAASTTENVRFNNMLLTGMGAGIALSMVNVERIRLDNVVIYGFKLGLYIHIDVSGEPYYHYITHCNFYDNVLNCQIGGSNSTFVGCYFWHSDSFALADYNIVVDGTQISFVGCAIEGRPNIAQIYNLSRGLLVTGGYSETRNYRLNGLKPFLKQLVSNDLSSSCPCASVIGVNNVTYLFENFDLSTSDSKGTATQSRFPIFGSGMGSKFIPAIRNGSLINGLYGWTVNFSEDAGKLTFDKSKVFNSFGALKLIHNGNNKFLTLNILPDISVTRNYVGRRVWMTALVFIGEGISKTDFVFFGAGNIQIKFGNVVVDYGNGWKLFVVDIPIIDSSSVTCLFRVISSTSNAAAWITNIQMFMDGYDLIPISRDVDLEPVNAPPSVGDWKIGDTIYSAKPKIGGYIGWVCVDSGSPGLWRPFGTIA